MRWKSEKPPEWKWMFPLFRPIVLDDGTRILWEWVQYRLTITREWGGMGADGCEGYTEFRNGRFEDAFGRITWRTYGPR